MARHNHPWLFICTQRQACAYFLSCYHLYYTGKENFKFSWNCLICLIFSSQFLYLYWFARSSQHLWWDLNGRRTSRETDMIMSFDTLVNVHTLIINWSSYFNFSYFMLLWQFYVDSKLSGGCDGCRLAVQSVFMMISTGVITCNKGQRSTSIAEQTYTENNNGDVIAIWPSGAVWEFLLGWSTCGMPVYYIYLHI